MIDRINVELAAAPENAAKLLQRAEIHLGHDEWKLALLDLQKVESLAPGKFPTRLHKGRALDQSGDHQSAKAELDAFVLANPKHAGALASRGRVHRKMGLREAALGDFRAALTLESKADPELALEFSSVLIEAAANAEAGDVLNACISKNGPNPSLLEKSLEVEMTLKHWDTALLRVDALGQSSPRPEPWMAKRAEILTAAGRAEEARAAWAAVVKHIDSLPNLERGTPALREIAATAQRQLSPKP